jgi:microcin C transport system permease protein
VLARVIYGFRLSVTFALIVTALTSVIGIAGAVQGYFGGRTDLIFQRVIEIWGSVPSLYVIIILLAVWAKSLLADGRADGPVRLDRPCRRGPGRVPARAQLRICPRRQGLGVPDGQIMFRHVLPNAMVATLTMLPFIVTGTIGSLARWIIWASACPPRRPRWASCRGRRSRTCRRRIAGLRQPSSPSPSC